MTGKRLTLTTVVLITVVFSLIAFNSCSLPPNPYTDPDNVTVNLILPDTVTYPVYTRDTTTLTIATTLSSLIDSVKLTINVVNDSLFKTVTDTMPVDLVFKDSGNVIIIVTAYCKDAVTKYCQKILYVHQNPLMPPDTVYTKTLSDSSVMLYWKKISVAEKYRVYRSLSDTGTFSLIATVTDTLYTDTPLSATTTYYYRISSLDSINIESDLSSVCAVTTSAVPLSKWDYMIWNQNKWE